MQDSIPENAQAKAIFISRIYVAIWISIILWSILVSSWMPLLFFVLPQFYGKTLHKLVAFTQHAGLARNCLLYTSPSPRDGLLSRMPSSA